MYFPSLVVEEDYHDRMGQVCINLERECAEELAMERKRLHEDINRGNGLYRRV